MRPQLSLLTDPMPIGQDFISETLIRNARAIKYILTKKYYLESRHIRGHFAVTRSLIEGLEKIGVDFNYNPIKLDELANTVIVLAGVRTLQQGIRLKREQKIQKLLAGPNVVHFSSDFGSILTSPEVDTVITPSNWVTESYVSDNPSLADKIFSWPAGVNTDFWKPAAEAKRNRILIFDKQYHTDDSERVKPFLNFLQGQGWNVDILIRRRGVSYTKEHFLHLLQNACLMVGLTGGSESQGIAWAEAWSADVPTLIFRQTHDLLHGRLLPVSTAPYLSEKNGIFFDDFEEFKKQYFHWKTHRNDYSPRKWVMENMSDEVCSKILFEKAISC